MLSGGDVYTHTCTLPPYWQADHQPGQAATGAPAAEQPDLEADSYRQLMSDLLVLPRQWLPWDLSLINNL